MYKFIALDLDGTLLNSSHELSAKTIHILRELSQKGVTVAVATGRSVRNVLPYIKQLDLPQPSIPVVLYNGAYGFELTKKDGEWVARELFGFPLPDNQCNAVLSFAEANNCVAQYYNGNTGEIYAAPKSEEHLALLKRYENLVGHPQTLVSSYSEAREKSLSAKCLVMTNQADEIISLANQHLAEFEFTIIRGSPFPFFVEFLVNGITKGNGLKVLCEKLGVNIDQVVAFGDGDNDAEMLEAAGLGVAMKNAKNVAKSRANVVLDWTNDEDGVARKLEELLEQNLLIFS